MYIPYYPTRWETIKKLVSILEIPSKARFIDLGSGGGRVISQIASKYDDVEVYGIEKNPLLVNAAKHYLDKYNIKATVIKGDLFKVNLNDFDIVYAYLTTDALNRLRYRIKNIIDRGKIFITFDFNVPGIRPTLTVNIDKLPGNHRIYFYGKRIDRYLRY